MSSESMKMRDRSQGWDPGGRPNDMEEPGKTVSV